jgi:hypothetical protein
MGTQKAPVESLPPTTHLCDYHGCQESADTPLPPIGGSWHLCKGHQAELDALIVAGNGRGIVGWWARGTDKEKVVAELTDQIIPFMRQLRERLQEADE